MLVSEGFTVTEFFKVWSGGGKYECPHSSLCWFGTKAALRSESKPLSLKLNRSGGGRASASGGFKEGVERFLTPRLLRIRVECDFLGVN